MEYSEIQDAIYHVVNSAIEQAKEEMREDLADELATLRTEIENLREELA